MSKNLTEDNWKEAGRKSGDYTQFRVEFMKMLSEFEYMWDDHLSSIKAAYHRINVSPEHTPPIVFTSYRAGFKAHQPYKSFPARMLHLEVIEPDQADCTSPTVFGLEKDGLPRLRVDCRKLNGVAVNNFHFIHVMDESITSFQEPKIF